MLEEDVKDVVQHLRIAMTLFVEMIPDIDDQYRQDLPEVKAHKAFVLQSFNTAFLKLTRALWPSTTYWNLLPGNRVKYNPDRGNLYHKRRYHAMICECFLMFVFFECIRNLYLCILFLFAVFVYTCWYVFIDRSKIVAKKDYLTHHTLHGYFLFSLRKEKENEVDRMKCQVGIPRVIADVPPRQMNPYLREYISHYFKYETR